jgi:octaprenyl-diphosphate synthase
VNPARRNPGAAHVSGARGALSAFADWHSGRSPDRGRSGACRARRYNGDLCDQEEPPLSPAAPHTAAAPRIERFADVQALAAADMAAVDTLIRTRLASDVVLINQVAEHIIGGGGKRLRPMLHLLAAQAAGYAGRGHLPLAALIEFIHTSTLLHDDVVDESDLRRGRKTANAVWGNAASVLVGDFLYSRSFQMMVELDSMRVMRILADTTNRIAEGEVLQLLNIGNPDTGERAYLDVIERKTAVLFAAATRLGAVLAGLPQEQEDALARYGLDLGYAFQIADDVLDYASDADTLGKNIGDDLAEGKPTLPLIVAIARSEPAQAARLKAAIQAGGLDALDDVLAAIRATGALDASRERAHIYSQRARDALGALPSSNARDALALLADYAVDRTR